MHDKPCQILPIGCATTENTSELCNHLLRQVENWYTLGQMLTCSLNITRINHKTCLPAANKISAANSVK